MSLSCSARCSDRVFDTSLGVGELSTLDPTTAPSAHDLARSRKLVRWSREWERRGLISS